MTKRLVTGAVLAAALLLALPGAAQDSAHGGPGWCKIEGTWYGANSAFLNFIFRIEKNAAGGYSIVADGFSDSDLINYCLEYTAWHGELVRIGPRTFRFRQIELCDPNPATFPPDLFPSETGLWLWASEGVLILASCNRLEADIPTTGAYVWGTGKVPFVDPFDVPFPDPVTGTFERMPRP
jgi:hypothetical protein